ncbi:MAG: two pore domain potassium channel family protein [Acidobacteria bacterium]|nr:two pore domain potassium channel family protein [Acidobacteriota bacterium]
MRFFRVIKYGLNDPTSRALFIATGVVLVLGTFVYTGLEGWSVFDSFYFCVTTLTTVGFGDPAPESTLAKAFTIPYILAGVGILMSFASTYLRLARELREQRRAE